MVAKWCFPSSNRGEIRGFNDSGIETFNDNPIKSLAREICQNSLDAVLPNKMAIVEFDTFTIENKDFPDKEGFEVVLQKCLDYCKDDKNTKASSFFKKAISRLNDKKISMLRISDFNTTGLRGDDWNNLIEKSGASEKADNKGGSFGIGKNAPFACSDFRTVFYSTLDLCNNKRSKGVSRLMSYKLGVNPDNSDNISQGTGYYGEDTRYQIKHLEEMFSLDKDFNRVSSGTDIYVPALKISNEKEFKSSIIAEVLDGFLIAIWQEKLEVRVNDYIINKSTLNQVIENYKSSLSENTVMCYELLADKEIEWYKLPIYLSGTMYLGDINFGFKLRFDGTNKVSIFRSSGMKIIDKSNLCPSLRFVGLATIEGDALNNFLRNLENPSHNKWEPHRSDDPNGAKNLLTAIYNSMTEKLNDVASTTFEDEIDIDGAGDYLPDEMEDDTSNKHISNNQECLNKIIDIEIKVLEKAKSVAHLETDEIGDDIQSSIPAEGEQSEGEGYDGFNHFGHKPDGSGERDFDSVGINPNDKMNGEELIQVKSKDIRIFCINKKEQIYRLIFIPTRTVNKGYIEIQRLAEQNEKMPLDIIGVMDNNLEYKRNKVGYFEFVENQPCKVDIKIDGKEYSTMEVKLYAYKG